jgi:hypothetical protein
LRAEAEIAAAPLRTVSAFVRWAIPLWWPVAVLTWRRPKPRRVITVAVAMSELADWRRRRPPLDPVRYAIASLADDIAYGAGVWSGCVRTGRVDPLLPRVSASRQPSSP